MSFRPSRPLAAACALAALLLTDRPAAAQDAAQPPAEPPRVTIVAPLAVPAGGSGPTTVRLRGLKLAGATEVRFPDAKTPVTANIKSKGPADVPQGADAASIGDSQVELGLTLPAETPAGPLSVVVVTPEGQTEPRTLQVVPATSLLSEAEPNGGFRQAQEVTPSSSTILQGSIQEPRDVDVFRFTGTAGQQVTAEVTAARQGSRMDAMLTLYDDEGNAVATADDPAPAAAPADPANPQPPPTPHTDPLLRVTLPADGTYYLAVVDAHDRGGPTHPYLLSVRPGE